MNTGFTFESAGRKRTPMERWIDLPNVEAVRQTRTELLCRIAGREVAVPSHLIRAGSAVWAWGDRGVLTVPFWFAVDVGLV
jgi:hypothetical protein